MSPVLNVKFIPDDLLFTQRQTVTYLNTKSFKSASVEVRLVYFRNTLRARCFFIASKAKRKFLLNVGLFRSMRTFSKEMTLTLSR